MWHRRLSVIKTTRRKWRHCTEMLLFHILHASQKTPQPWKAVTEWKITQRSRTVRVSSLSSFQTTLPSITRPGFYLKGVSLSKMAAFQRSETPNVGWVLWKQLHTSPELPTHAIYNVRLWPLGNHMWRAETPVTWHSKETRHPHLLASVLKLQATRGSCMLSKWRNQWT